LPPEASENQQWVTIALLTGSRGNRGEVQAVSFSDRPERFRELKGVYLCDPESPEGEPMEMEAAWEHRGRMIFKFRGIDSISEAERLRGKEVRIPLAERPSLPAGEYYDTDLIGCEVLDRAAGGVLGRVKGLQRFGGPPLLEVEAAAGGEFLIPFAGSICAEIDIEKKQIRVDLPEGLQDLNR